MNDLRTLIDLCPGIRLPQHEEEIFSDKKLTKYYLRKLCEQYWWCGYYDTSPDMIYFYASEVMKCRWPEAEPVIAADREYRKVYNSHFGTNLQ